MFACKLRMVKKDNGVRLCMCVLEQLKGAKWGKGWSVSWVAPPAFFFLLAGLEQHRKWEGVARFFGVIALGSRRGGGGGDTQTRPPAAPLKGYDTFLGSRCSPTGPAHALWTEGLVPIGSTQHQRRKNNGDHCGAPWSWWWPRSPDTGEINVTTHPP